MKTFKEFFQLGVTKPSKFDVQNYLNGLGTRLMQISDIKKKIINHFKNIKNLKLDSFGRKVLSFEEFIPETRDYKAEYKKHQSSPERIKYRAELVKYNRDKGTYGNGDGKDASHKDGKIVGFEAQSKNRGRAEASRLKGSKRKVDEAVSKYIVTKNPSDKKWYAMGHVGSNKWMPVSSGFKNKAQAQKWAKSQDKVDIAARGEISGA